MPEYVGHNLHFAHPTFHRDEDLSFRLRPIYAIREHRKISQSYHVSGSSHVFSRLSAVSLAEPFIASKAPCCVGSVEQYQPYESLRARKGLIFSTSKCIDLFIYDHILVPLSRFILIMICRDEVVPFWHGQELFLGTPTKWRAKPFWVDGAGHNNIEALLR